MTRRLNILHVAHIDNHQHSGVAVVVPNYLKYQAPHANVALLNLASHKPKGSDLIYPTFLYENDDLSSLELPFNTPDLVVFHEVYRPAFAKIAKRLTQRNIPYIITPHVSLTKTAQHHKRIKKVIGNALIFGNFIKDAAAIHYLSESEMVQSKQFSKIPSFICGNGIELKGRMKKKFSKKGLRLIYVGRLEIKIKGIDRLLDTANLTQRGMRDNGIRLTIRGYDEANNSRWIKDKIAEYGISDIVDFGGPLFGADKVKEILKHDCFIQLSRTEGQPLAIMEAMDMGMPIIVTQGTTFGDIALTERIGFFVVDEPGDIGRSIEDIVSRSDELEDISIRSSRYANEYYAWNRVSKIMVKEYLNILNNGINK